MLMEDRLNQRLHELGRKKSWLMEKLGLSSATFWRKITGKSPLTYEEMALLAEALECSPEYLTGRADDPKIEASPHETDGRTGRTFQASRDLDDLVRDLAGIDPDLAVLFRNAKRNWKEFSPKTKEKMAAGLKFTLGLAELDELKESDGFAEPRSDEKL